jgi:hypothetical protein
MATTTSNSMSVNAERNFWRPGVIRLSLLDVDSMVTRTSRAMGTEIIEKLGSGRCGEISEGAVITSCPAEGCGSWRPRGVRIIPKRSIFAVDIGPRIGRIPPLQGCRPAGNDSVLPAGWPIVRRWLRSGQRKIPDRRLTGNERRIIVLNSPRVGPRDALRKRRFRLPICREMAPLIR